MNAKGEQPDPLGRRFSYVMGQEDPLDTSHTGFMNISEVNQEREKPPPKVVQKQVVDVEDAEEEDRKKDGWKKNELIPRRFDQLPTEEDWVNVSDVIKRQREEAARQEARQNKLKPPEDPASEESDGNEEVSKPPIGKQGGGRAQGKWQTERDNFREADDDEGSHGIDNITQSMLNFALRPGVMTKSNPMGRRSSLPITPSTPHGRPYHEQRRGSLFPTMEGYNTGHYEEHSRQSPREQHHFLEERRERPSRSRWESEGEKSRYREPSPDYNIDEAPPRPQQDTERHPHKHYNLGSQYPQRGNPQKDDDFYYRDHDPRYDYHPRQHDTGYNPRERHHDYNQDYQEDPRQRGPQYDYRNQYPDRRYQEDDYHRSPHYDDGRRQDYFRQQSDPRHERGGDYYRQPEYDYR